MDTALRPRWSALRDPLLVIALTPVIPQVLGSIFNIWYNLQVVDPLLRAAGLRDRFISTVIVWNAIAFPAAIAIWVRLVFSLRPVFRRLLRDEVIPTEELDAARRRLVNLPWSGAIISAVTWLLCIPYF